MQLKKNKIIQFNYLKKIMASKFQTKIKNHFKKEGYTVLNIIKLSDNGYPDLYCFKKDCIDVWIESKEANDTLKELQKERINELNKAGKIAFCLQSGKGIIFGSEELTKYFEKWI
tara:strand:- start:158 stop:502 length:345 start_codon:yes stop_codon:yes gene_type:complete